MNIFSKVLSRLGLNKENSQTPDSVNEVQIVFECLRGNTGPENTMLDIGAHYGGSLSSFAKIGWSIFAFEPDPLNREQLMKRIEGFDNVSVDQRAVSDVSGQSVAFFTSDVSSGISGMSSFHKSHVQTGTVETITLSDYCKENEIGNIDFLKIDTEGFDLMVLKGFDWEKEDLPKFILTEFENRKTIPLGYTFLDQVEFLRDKGYFVLISEWHPIVEYGTSHKWNRFITDPNLVDNPNAWGNLIACRQNDARMLTKQVKKMGYKIS